MCSDGLFMLPEVKDRIVHSKEDLGSNRSRSLSHDEGIIISMGIQLPTEGEGQPAFN